MFVYLILLLCICNLNECRKPNVLVIGGSGRVGGSALRSLLKQNIIGDVGGRDIRNWKAYLRRFPDLTNTVRFQQMDIFNEKDRNEILPRYDLIINTAGPFQGLSEPLLLESCLKHGVAYLDVCDDIALSRIARGEKFQKLASSTHTPAVISAGIWPGISSLLAQQLLRDIQQQSSSSEQRAMSLEQRSVKPKNCRFNFFTAGSGGAGQTILTATFLLLGEPVLSYQNGSAVYFKTASDPISRDFGPGIGEREIVRLNLIECESCHSAYSAEYPASPPLSIETRFGTAPPIWNTLFSLMAKTIPGQFLQDRAMMQAFAQVSLPMVRIVDHFVGKNNGIQIEVECDDGKIYTILLTHADLENEVGECLAGFAVSMLEHRAALGGGVYFPEEIPCDELKRVVMKGSRDRALFFSSSILTH